MHTMASELIALLQSSIDAHGDHPVVSGLGRTGYGESIICVSFEPDVKNAEGETEPVFDIQTSDESIVAVGGF